jgi:hypothetical protein
VAILEVVVRGSLVVRAWLLEHLVEDTPARGASRLLAVSSGDKIVRHSLVLALLILLVLPPVVPLGTPVGALRILVLVVPPVLVTTKDGTNRLLAGGVVGDDVHQLVSSGRGVAAQLPDQLLANGSREKSHDDVGVGDVGKLSTLFGETSDIVTERLARLLFTAPKVPRVAGAYIGPFEVPLEHLFQVVPVVDLSRWEVLEPGSSSVR